MKIQINKAFQPVFESNNRYIILRGGGGSGKSWAVAQKIVSRCLTECKHRFLIIRKTFPALKSSCWTLIRSTLEKFDEKPEVNKSDLIIRFSNGNEILFKSMDDPEKIKSIEGITGIWIEEATEISENEFTQLDLRLRGNTETYKQIILSFNPIDAGHWIKQHFFDSQVDDCLLHFSNYKSNKFIDSEYCKILEDLKNTNPHLHKIYALGEWGTVEGLIYENWQTVRLTPEEGDSIYYGLDFGFNNPTALVKIVEKDKELFIQEKIYQSGLTTNDLIEKLKECDIKRHRIYCDSAEPDRIEELFRNGFNAMPSVKDVQAGISYCQSQKLHIDVNSVSLIKEIQGYSWSKDKNGKSIDEPVKFNDHCLDAMRYAIYTHSKNKKVAVSDIGAYTIKDNNL